MLRKITYRQEDLPTNEEANNINAIIGIYSVKLGQKFYRIKKIKRSRFWYLIFRSE